MQTNCGCVKKQIELRISVQLLARTNTGRHYTFYFWLLVSLLRTVSSVNDNRSVSRHTRRQSSTACTISRVYPIKDSCVCAEKPSTVHSRGGVSHVTARGCKRIRFLLRCSKTRRSERSALVLLQWKNWNATKIEDRLVLLFLLNVLHRIWAACSLTMCTDRRFYEWQWIDSRYVSM